MPAIDIQRFLRALLAALPLHAEEGTLREVVSEADLLSRIQTGSNNPVAAQVVVEMMRRLYDSLALFEQSELIQGRWAFVSFPASLIARSLLETLATERQALFESGYWIQGGHQMAELPEQQRELLRRLESHRIHSHPQGTANPIRTVHVAWGIVRLGGHFPLRAREDKKRPEVKGHVFPGGRLDPTDLPAASRSPDALRDLFRVTSTLAKDALPITLSRELREELDLVPSDYQATYQRTLAPFKMLEGTRNTHVYTQYNVAIYTVQLTRAGELKLLDRVGREPDGWAWFTAADLAAGKRADGKSAFVDALAAELGHNIAKYLLEEIPESSTTPPAYRSDNDSIELPARADEPLLKGMAGRERAFSFTPDRREWALLMILGWHSRGLKVHVHEEAITLLGAGWIKLNNSALLEIAQNMAQRLEGLGFPFVESDSLGHCRLSIASDQVFFHPDCFEYSWRSEGPKKCIVLALKEIEATWATLARSDLLIPLAPNFNRNLSATEAGKEPKGDFERESRDHFEPARAIGLRKFIAATKKAYEILVPARAL